LIAREEDLVRQSMEMIALTDVSERPFVTRNGVPFGTRIRRALFSPPDVAGDIVRFELKRAFDLWEPRVIVEFVTAEQTRDATGSVAIVSNTFYRFRSTNRSDNYVLPFRLSSVGA